MLGAFLRKNQRALKLGTLACLTAMVTHHAASIKPAALEPVLSELPPLVDESDMHVSQVRRLFGGSVCSSVGLLQLRRLTRLRAGGSRPFRNIKQASGLLL